MALTTTNLVNVYGLNTEGSIFDSNQTPPNSLYDCRNVVFRKHGQAISRKGLPVWVADGTYYANPVTSIYPTISSLSHFFITYGSSNITQGYLTDGTTQTANAVVNQITTSSSIPVNTTAITIYQASYVANKELKWVDNNGTSLVMMPNGLFRSLNITSGVNGRIRKVPLPIISDFTIGSSSAATDLLWFKSGYAFKAKAVVEVYYPKTGGFYSSPVSIARSLADTNHMIMMNLGTDGGAKVSMIIDTSNIPDLSWAVLKIYRTLQYKPGDVEEVEYHLCYETALTLNSPQITTSNQKTTITDIILTANDDFIRGAETIYTDLLNDGPDGETVPVPASQDFTEYKNYMVYAGGYRAPYVVLDYVALPSATGETFNISPDGTNGFTTPITLNRILNSTTQPPASGVMSTLDAFTFKGTVQYGPTGATDYYYLSIRTIDPTVDNSAVVGCVSTYARIQGISKTGTNGTAIMKVTADVNLFDISKFSSPGIMALVDKSGIVKDIIQYRDFEQVPVEGKINFFDCSTIMPDSASGDYAPISGTGADRGFLYFLQGTAVENLPFYPIPSDSTASSGASGVSFSLQPLYYTFPTKKFMDKAVGRVNGLSYDTTADRVKMAPEFYGLLWKDQAARLKASAQLLCDDINKQRTSETKYWQPYAKYVPPFSVLLMGSMVGVTSATGMYANSGYYDAVYLKGSLTGAKFSEALTSSYVNYSEEVNIKNSLIFGKESKPEEVPLQYHLSPLKVGDDNKDILRVAVNNDQLYVFKDQEGVYRVELSEGYNIAQYSSRAVVDNTVWLVARYSLQVFNESIYFLSNKGIVQLTNGQIAPIARAIESDIRTAYLTETTPDLIRSWHNEITRTYGIYFPTVNKTYVVDVFTGQWSIWNHKFTASYVSSNGVQYFACPTTIESTDTWPIRKDTAGDLASTAGQYDEIVPLTSATISYSFGASAHTLTVERLTLGGSASGFGKLSNLYYMRGNLATDNINSGNHDFCYLLQGNTLTRLFITSVVTAAGRLVFDVDSTTAITTPTTAHSLIVGVNSYITFNRFYITGSMNMNQYSEAHAHITGRATGVGMAFEADKETPSFSANMLFMDATFEQLRTLIPKDQSRGRWIQTKVRHATPYEFLNVAGIGYVYKDMQTFRTKQKNV